MYSAITSSVTFPIERAEPKPVPEPGKPSILPLALAALAAGNPSRLELADRSIDLIARNGSADLARAFRGRYAPIRQMILESTSVSDLETKLAAYQADHPGLAGELIEEALTAFVVNGCVR